MLVFLSDGKVFACLTMAMALVFFCFLGWSVSFGVVCIRGGKVYSGRCHTWMSEGSDILVDNVWALGWEDWLECMIKELMSKHERR